MNAEELKYVRFEYERRFLVPSDAEWRKHIEPYSKRLDDKYLSNTRLRLRLMTDSDTGRQVRKLNKKADTDTPCIQTVSRILLSAEEYRVLNDMEGHRLSKTRYYHNHLGRAFALDAFEGELESLVLCEAEGDSLGDLHSIEFPDYVGCEVTGDPFFKGGSLCHATRAQLADALSKCMWSAQGQ